MSVLGEKLLALNQALASSELPYAFGGAIAFGYCAEEPRGTRDLDINIFLGPEHGDDVFSALPDGVQITAPDRATLARDGQVRLMWDKTPVDLFFNMHPFHEEAYQRVRTVPFEGVNIPVLGCDSLAVFKAMFNRFRDWGDIESMLEAGAIDGPAVLRRLQELLGDDHESVKRFAEVMQSTG